MEKKIDRLDRDLPHSNMGIHLAIPILGLAGMGISGYLTYIHYQNLNSICLFGAKCDEVLTSPYSQIWGIPLALFGLFMYAVLTVMGLLLLSKRIARQDLLALGIYAVALSGTLFSIYLYYLEIFEIHAFCTWCIASSLVMFSLLACSLINLKKSGFSSKEFRSWFRIRLARYVKW